MRLPGWTMDVLQRPYPLQHSGSAVLGQLARWLYPFGSGAHCNNYYYYSGLGAKAT
jgi:hypothetical protein